MEKESYAVLYVLKMKKKKKKAEMTTASKLGANLDREIEMYLVRSSFSKIRNSWN